MATGKASIPTETAAIAEPEVEADTDDESDLIIAAPKPEVKAKASKPVEKKPEVGRSTLTSLADLANIDELMRSSAEMDETMSPDITGSIQHDHPPSVAGLDYDVETDAPADEPAGAFATQDEDFEDYDEEEDDEDWGGARRKPKAGKRRREPKRDF